VKLGRLLVLVLALAAWPAAPARAAATDRSRTTRR